MTTSFGRYVATATQLRTRTRLAWRPQMHPGGVAGSATATPSRAYLLPPHGSVDGS
jgi:hypothetical protein